MGAGNLLSSYVLIALAIAAYLSFKEVKRQKLIAFVMSFGILGGSVIHMQQYNLPLHFLGGDMQIKRLIFLVLAGHILVFSLLRSRKREPTHRLPYEKYFYLFFFWFMVVVGYHWLTGLYTTRDLIGYGEAMLIIPLGYVIIKRNADSGMIRVLGKSVVIVAVLSTAVAVMQFVYDPWFMRVGSALDAFGGRYRSNGVFLAEYFHSYMCVAAFMITLVGVPKGALRKFLIGTELVGILLSFHRMSWIVTIVVFLTYLMLHKRQSFKRLMVMLPVIFAGLFFLTMEVFPIVSTFQQSSFYKGRIAENTMETRYKLNQLVLENINQIYLWGSGGNRSKLYYYLILQAGMGTDWATGTKGGFHNLFIYYLFYYGGPFVIIFCVMLLMMGFYFWKQVRLKRAFFLGPLLFIIMIILMNMTNAIAFESDFGFYVAVFMGCAGAVAGKQLEDEHTLSVESI
jgi:hypothetical protein